MPSQNDEELKYLREALQMLEDSLAKEEDPRKQSRLRQYIASMKSRIDSRRSD